MIRTRRFMALAAAASFVVSACSAGGASTAPSTAPSGAAALDEVRLQLQWAPQAQFAGYFAAVEQGYYEANGIALTIIDGGPEVIPQQAGSAADGPEFTISWVPKVLEAREGNPASDLVNIAQIFQRSGTLSVSWKDSNITGPADFSGQEGRRLGLRQRVRGHGRRQEGRSGAGHRLREGHPAVRHDAAAVEADRRRRGDDLQRVRPGPRGQEPRDRQALPADRPQRHQLE